MNQDWQQELRALLAGPKDAAAPYVIGGCENGRDFSHGDLYRLAARLHRALADISEPVCLATDDKPLFAAALLAALAGTAPLLLPHALSPQALAGLREATGCRLALALPETPLPPGLARIDIDDDDAPPLPQTPVDLNTPMLRMFTGGSTGAPQLWSKTATNLFGESLFLAHSNGVSPSDRLMASIAPYHIYGLLFSVLMPLVSGASVLAASPAFPEEMAASAADNDISLFISVPAHYRALALSGKMLAAPGLRLAFSSAGPLDPGDNDAFCAANNVGIVEVFGSTETGGMALRNRHLGETDFTATAALVWQVSPEERLMLRSPFLSPELPRDEAGWFHTADRVARLDERRFRLIGRADLVVKVAGQRVDLDEVRRALAALPGVAEALVLALPDGGSRDNLIAAVVSGEAGSPPDAAALRRALSERLEPYALPRRIRVLERIPVRENGKYDREAVLGMLTE